MIPANQLAGFPNVEEYAPDCRDFQLHKVTVRRNCKVQVTSKEKSTGRPEKVPLCIDASPRVRIHHRSRQRQGISRGNRGSRYFTGTRFV